MISTLVKIFFVSKNLFALTLTELSVIIIREVPT